MTQNLRPFTVAVTGGNGYVGSAIRRSIRAAGWRAISLQRSPGDADSRPFSLDRPLAADLFDGIDVLVHAAYDFRAYGRAAIHIANVDHSMNLLRTAKGSGVKRSILISSISAFEGCVSEYGRAKLELEKQAAGLGTAVIRPGLVWGESGGGMMGALAKLAAIPFATPVVGSGNQLQYLDHEEDLGSLIVRLAAEETLPAGPIIAAHPTPVMLRQILIALAGRKKVLVPIPWRLLWLGLKTLETFGLRPRTRSDSLVSLMNSVPNPDFSTLRGTAVPFRPFPISPAE